jgi:hypothetical protein
MQKMQNRSNLIILTDKSYLLIFFISKLSYLLTKQLGIRKLITCILSDFMQFLNNTRKHSTKNEYFTMPVILTIIYLLREQKLNPNKYSEQK